MTSVVSFKNKPGVGKNSASKTTENGVVSFFVVWRSVVMKTAFKIEVV